MRSDLKIKINLLLGTWYGSTMLTTGLLLGTSSFGQQINKDHILSASAHYGFILPHHGSMQYLINGHTPGFEINYIKPSHGEKKWERIYHYPEIGLNLFFISLSNPSQLGDGMALSPFINFNLNHGKRFQIMMKWTTSVGYMTKKFDRLENHKNTVVGSNFNMYANLRFNAVYNFSPSLRMEMGLGMSHFSNGASSMPNLGINIPTLDLGFGYHFNAENTHPVWDTFSIPPKTSRVAFYAGMGINSIDPPGSQKYGGYTLSANYERKRGNKNRWCGGLELSFNSSYLAEFRQDSTVHLTSDLQNLQVGVKGGYALIIGRLFIPIEMGCYLYSMKKSNGPIFHRIGTRVQVNDHLVVGVTLKTHWAKADFFELCLGYTMKEKVMKIKRRPIVLEK